LNEFHSALFLYLRQIRNFMKEERIIRCIGCELECEVVVCLVDGEIVTVEGNNCPTGASYACSQCVLSAETKPGK